MPLASFVVQVRPGGDGLHRVLAVCHRRDVAIRSLRFFDDEIRLTVDGDRRQLRQLRHWLAASPGVLCASEDRQGSTGLAARSRAA